MPITTRKRAFTLYELLFVIAALGALVMLWPLGQVRMPKQQFCINYLKQIGTGYRLWANDHDEKLPMQLSTNAGGTSEYTHAGQAYLHFLAASDEITSPRAIVCPEDRKRVAARDFSTNPVLFNNSNVSYFINLKAEGAISNTILAGDRHLNVPQGRGDLFAIRRDSRAAWTKELHTKWGANGNVLIVDGSVQQFSNRQLQGWFNQNTNDHLFHFPNLR